MENFEIALPTHIFFGKGYENNVGDYVKTYSDKILFHYGSGSIKRSGLYDRVVTSLKKAKVDFVEFGGVEANPKLSFVREGIELCRKHKIKFILAVGGGSVIDSAKAIAMGVEYDGDVWDFFAKKASPVDVLPVATILTIPAAGSECSPNAVITNEEEHIKVGVKCQKCRPVFSILNPELCITLPKHQMTFGVCDMMCHIMERYFSMTEHTDATNGLCESVMRTIIRNASILTESLDNYDAWAEIMWCGTIAHNGILGVGRVEDWASHAIEHQLSALYNIAHGEGLAIIAPAWMKYVHKENLKVFVRFAENVFGIKGANDEVSAMAGITAYEEFFRSIGLKTRLSEIGIDDKNFAVMAAMAVKNGAIGNFKKLNAADVEKIYRLAM